MNSYSPELNRDRFLRRHASLGSLRAATVALSLYTQLHLAVDLSSAQQITGFAKLPGATFAAGPTSGQFIVGTNGVATPFVGQQPVQGFSGILDDGNGGYLVLTDNGFGAKANSADSLLRFHNVTVDFKTASGGSGTVVYKGNVTLSDPDRKINFPIVADQAFYPNGATNVPVDATITAGRLLTGADFDLESFRRAADGTFWFGEEFGPFLLHTDAQGKVLEAPIPLPGIQSPSNPLLGGQTANLPNSRGFEGMAISADGLKLYPILEGPLTTDPDQRKLIIFEFDTVTKSYTDRRLFYKMDSARARGNHIGDFSPVGQNKFVLTETDLADAPSGVKRLFLLDLNRVDSSGFVAKTLLVDLLRIPDPNHLASPVNEYPMPFSTIESLILTAADELLILNDNNYPFSAGRIPGVADNEEFIRIKFPQPLENIPVPGLFPTLTGQDPLVIGHRGAAGYRPDHTLAGYLLAIEMGADYIEPDLVSTKDGVLIARHEPMLGGTTDVGSHAEFADRKSTKMVDGVAVTDWFASDFTLAEIKTLRAIQPLGRRDQSFNGLYEVPTFTEVIELAKAQGALKARTIGIYPETKHPTFHDSLGLSLEEPLLAALTAAGWNTSNAPVYIQSFEVSNLRQLNQMTEVRLVQLIDADDVNADGSLSLVAPYAQPYDFVISGDPRTFADLLTPAGLDFVRTYADGVGPWKPYLLKTRIYDPNGDGMAEDRNGDGTVDIKDREIVGDTGVIAAAHRAGLVVHAFTFRDDASLYGFRDPISEYQAFFRLGVDGLFSDYTDTGVASRARLHQVGNVLAIEPLGHSPKGLRARVFTEGGKPVLIESSTTLAPTASWSSVMEVAPTMPVWELDLPLSGGSAGYYRLRVP
ncbi:MAG: esterase-like activity of phytase family protein [Verrucomicrobiales bacterium]|nr:esterase-like activity of phytase family protein [Verrucomicrobiales bacterium]